MRGLQWVGKRLFDARSHHHLSRLQDTSVSCFATMRVPSFGRLMVPRPPSWMPGSPPQNLHSKIGLNAVQRGNSFTPWSGDPYSVSLHLTRLHRPTNDLPPPTLLTVSMKPPGCHRTTGTSRDTARASVEEYELLGNRDKKAEGAGRPSRADKDR